MSEMGLYWFSTWDRSQFDVEIVVFPIIGPTMLFDKIVSNNDIIGTTIHNERDILQGISGFQLYIDICYFISLFHCSWYYATYVEVSRFPCYQRVLL